MNRSTSWGNGLTPVDAAGNSLFPSVPQLIYNAHVVVGFYSVQADEYLHRASSGCRDPEEAFGVLMDAFEARYPISRVASSSISRGTM